jgi:hypothetical protein
MATSQPHPSVGVEAPHHALNEPTEDEKSAFSGVHSTSDDMATSQGSTLAREKQSELQTDDLSIELAQALSSIVRRMKPSTNMRQLSFDRLSLGLEHMQSGSLEDFSDESDSEDVVLALPPASLVEAPSYASMVGMSSFRRGSIDHGIETERTSGQSNSIYPEHHSHTPAAADQSSTMQQQRLSSSNNTSRADSPRETITSSSSSFDELEKSGSKAEGNRSAQGRGRDGKSASGHQSGSAGMMMMRAGIGESDVPMSRTLVDLISLTERCCGDVLVVDEVMESFIDQVSTCFCRPIVVFSSAARVVRMTIAVSYLGGGHDVLFPGY